MGRQAVVSRWLRLSRVSEDLGIDPRTLHRLAATGAFPRIVHLTPRICAVERAQFEQWSARLASSGSAATSFAPPTGEASAQHSGTSTSASPSTKNSGAGP